MGSRMQQSLSCLTSASPSLFPIHSNPAQYEVIDLVSSETDSEAGGVSSSLLHEEIREFATRCLPRRREVDAVESVLSTVHNRVRVVLPGCTVSLFGSKATGLSLPSSDLDLVILGTPFDIYAPRDTYSRHQRSQLLKKLTELKKELRPWMSGHGKVIQASIPILRIEMQTHGVRLKVDISIGVRNSIEAVAWIRSHICANPAALPLFVVLKALLKEERLNEVYQGGMSSYVLFNTVVAHLMMEGCFSQPTTSQSAINHSEFTSQHQSAFLQSLIDSIQLPLDVLLLSYLKRFGNWDKSMAVSAKAQGVIPVTQLRDVIAGRILHVEDPQAPRKDAAKGTFEMPRVLSVFCKAGEKLEAYLARHHRSRHDTHHAFTILDQIITPQAYLHRPKAVDASRKRSCTLLETEQRSVNKHRRKRDSCSSASKVAFL